MSPNSAVVVRGGELVGPENSSHKRLVVTACILAVATLLLLLPRIDHPATPYWDEGIYVRIARSLLHGTLAPTPREFSPESFGRQHPPLGPFLIEAGMKVAGDTPLGWRMASVLSGVLSVVAIFLWTYLLLRDYGLALTAAVLTLLNNFLYVMARIGMLDIFMFTFSMLAVLAFTAALVIETSTTWRRILLAISGVLFGLGFAVKWNTIDTLAAVLLIAITLRFGQNFFSTSNPALGRAAQNLKSVGLPAVIASLIILPTLVYVIAFVPLLRATNTPVTPSEFLSLHSIMINLTKAAPGNPAQFSPWYRWPFRITPVRGLSYLLGNPVVMWGGVLAVVVCVIRLLRSFRMPEAMVVLLYGANLLQWAVTPIRIPNYYYYVPAAMFLAPAIAIALNTPRRRQIFGIRATLIVMVFAAVVFLYCYPRMAYLESPWDCMFGCW